MLDQFVKEQRDDLRKMKSLIALAEKGDVKGFDYIMENHLGDEFLKEKVKSLKDKAGEMYRKEIEARAFTDEFRERPLGTDAERWNLTAAGRVPDWVVNFYWKEDRFYKDFVSKQLGLEVEFKERNIIRSTDFSLSR